MDASVRQLIGTHCLHACVSLQVFSFGILIQQMITRSTPYQRNDNGVIEVNKQFWKPTPGSCPALMDLRRRCGFGNSACCAQVVIQKLSAGLKGSCMGFVALVLFLT